MSSRKILITGGSGFIGYHLTKRLLENSSDRVVLIDNFQRGPMDADFTALCASPQIELIKGNLRDPETLKAIGKGYNEVYHLAAMLGVENVLKRPVDVLRTNALLTAEFLEWFIDGGGKKLLFSSTSEAYAWTQQFYELPVPTPENVPLAFTDLSNPRITYAGSKIFGELCVTQYCNSANLDFVIARYHNVYGPRMGYDHVIPQLHERVLGGEAPLTVYSADHLRAFCYVDDAVTATIEAMRVPEGARETFNIGNDDEEVTIGDLAGRILAKNGKAPTIVAKEAANDPIKRRCPDVSKARRVLGYAPSVSLDAGLDLTMAWYAKNPRKRD